MSYSIENLHKQIMANRPEVTNPETAAGGVAKYTSRIPLKDQMIAARNKLRADEYIERNIKPTQTKLAECEALDLDILHYLETGAVEAIEYSRQHEANKKAHKRMLKQHWATVRMMRKQYLKEGLSESEHNRCFGALCGRWELHPDTTMETTPEGFQKLNLDSVTIAVQRDIITDIHEDIDDEEHRNGEQGDTCAEYVLEDEGEPDAIGDNTEADTSDLLKTEFAAMDAETLRRRKELKEKIAACAPGA